MRYFTLRALAAILAFSAPVILSAAEWNKKYSLSGKPDLRLETNDASVTIHGGDVHWIEARVTTNGWKIEPSEVTIVESQTGDLVNLGVRVPSQFMSIGNRSVHIDLVVPRQLVAFIKTGDGRITAQGLGGDLRLNTGDGQISARGIDGNLDATTSDGRMEVSGRFDKLNLKTNDGHVVLKIAEGSKMAGPWRVQTGDGGVEISVADKFGADLDAHTGDGSISVDVPATVKHLKGNSYRGALNGGGENFVVRTGDGSIRVSRTIL